MIFDAPLVPEEFEKRLDDYKLFTQGLLDMVLDTLMNYKILLCVNILNIKYKR